MSEPVDIEVCLEEECDDMPPVTEMAKNLFSDATALLKNAVTGGPTLVPDELREARWETCQACPLLQNDRCTKCGCFMRVKVAFTVTKCPVGKW